MENNLMKEEWINGIVMMSLRPEHNHMEVMRQLYKALDKYFGNKCKVAMEEALFLTKDNPKELKNNLVKLKELITAKRAELSPDIAVYCDKEQIFRRGFLGIPQLIVEVLSPSNSEDDTVKKRAIYESFGVPEYWIVNPHSKKAIVLNLKDNKYEIELECNFLEEDIKSARLEDLVVDIKDIELYEDNEFEF